MFDETLLTAAICGDRAAYDTAMRVGLDSADFGEAARCIVRAAAEQYERDPELHACTAEVLRAQVTRRYGEGSMTESIMDFVETFPSDISRVNVLDEYRLLRLSRVSTDVATRLAMGKHDDETQELLSKYQLLRAGNASGVPTKLRLTADDFVDDGTAGQRVPIMPATLNGRIGGGVLRGHNITVYGRPDSGKSLFVLNQAAYAIAHGLTVLYVANEEPDRDITKRLLSRLLRRPIASLHKDSAMREAIGQAEDIGHYQNWNLLHRAGCTAKDVGQLADEVRPDIIIVDQLKNLSTGKKGDNRALELDRLARDVRELGIEHNAVTISVTQAGDSASNVLNLSMNDVEWSNTGIPGAADLMIGIGHNQEFFAQNKRKLSLPKNKINGWHGSIDVWIDVQHTAFLARARA